MRTFCMTLAYDGGRYNGWQKQTMTANTIQGKLERLLTDLLQEKIEIQGAGRTDAGVHALGQCASFHTENWRADSQTLMDAINARLPEDIAVVGIEEKENRFHSRLNAKGKWYAYTIWQSKMPPVFRRKYVFRCDTLDVAAMQQAASHLVGEHDFAAFCGKSNLKKSTVRQIYAIRFVQDENAVTIHYYGNGFLYLMVRILTGTLIEVGEGKRSPESVKEVLEGKSRVTAGFTAPPQGLVLHQVYYDKEQLRQAAKGAKT